MSRVMRCACWRMMSRKRSRATGVVAAGPCSVSTKPSSDAKRRAQFVACIGDEIRPHRLKPASRREIAEEQDDAGPGVAVQRLRPQRADMDLEGPLGRHMFGILDPQAARCVSRTSSMPSRTIGAAEGEGNGCRA